MNAPYQGLVCTRAISSLVLFWYLKVVHTIRLQTPQGISTVRKLELQLLGAFVPTLFTATESKTQQKPNLQPSLLVPVTGKSRMCLGPLSFVLHWICLAMLSNTQQLLGHQRCYIGYAKQRIATLMSIGAVTRILQLGYKIFRIPPQRVFTSEGYLY